MRSPRAQSLILGRGLLDTELCYRTAYLSARQWRSLTLLFALLIVSAGVRLPGLFSRAIWEDESVVLLEMAGHTVPSWPAEPAPARLAKSQFQGSSSLKRIVDDLGSYDSHPPLYYWSVFLWRQWWGPSLNATRAFSLICSIAVILALYGLLRVAEFESPFIPTWIYAFSSGSVHFGQEARSYALVTLSITLAALCAYLATEAQNRSRGGVYAMAAGLFSGAAFATHYFALFPACVILVWFLANARPGFRLIALATVIVACLVACVGLLTLSGQIKVASTGHRGSPIGYYGHLKEVVTVGQMNVNLLWKPSVSLFKGTLAGLGRGLIYGGWVVLLGSSVLLLLRHSLEGRRKFWVLVLGLAIAPSAGLMLLDFLWKRHLHIDRYLACSGPALAVIAGYALAKVLVYRPKLGWCLAAGVLLIQLTGINWGKESDAHMGSRMRSLAKMIQVSPASSRVVVIGEDERRWQPASALIYELEPDVIIVTLGRGRDLDELHRLIDKFEYVWVVCGEDCSVESAENELLNRLLRSGLYVQSSSYPAHRAVLLHRAGESPGCQRRPSQPLRDLNPGHFEPIGQEVLSLISRMEKVPKRRPISRRSCGSSSQPS
jgi:uncharacterized membrane protein